MCIVLLVCMLGLNAAQIFYPAVQVRQIPVLQNGNVTLVQFIETASPVPLVARDARGRRLVQQMV